jgi:hypothetical protein
MVLSDVRRRNARRERQSFHMAVNRDVNREVRIIDPHHYCHGSRCVLSTFFVDVENESRGDAVSSCTENFILDIDLAVGGSNSTMLQ